MPTALLSSHTRSTALSSFADTLVRQGWTIIATPDTSEFLAQMGIPSIHYVDLGCMSPFLSDELQIGLTAENTPANRSLAGHNLINLLIVDFKPISNVIHREDVGDRLPVFMESTRASMVMCAIVGFRPVVTDLNDLPRVLDWIECDELRGPNLRWLWAKALTTLSLRMTELAKHVSYGTSPGGMLIDAGLPAPDSPEWAKARTRPRDALTA